MEIRIALLYTTWTGDDMEMLKRSIENNSVCADGVIVGFQCISNRNEYSRHFKMQDSLNSSDVAIKLFHWEPDLTKSTKENERIKHNKMIQFAKREGYTHFILCAGDHFYEPKQIEFAKKWHLEHPEIDVSITRMITYYKNENWCLYPLESYCMPFIHKIKPETEISKTVKYPVVVDPSVKVNASTFHVFKENEVILHHYSMIRKDIEKKFRNAAASVRWSKEQTENFISEYQNAELGHKLAYFNGLELVEKEKVLEFIK